MSNINLPGYDVPIELGGGVNPTWYETFKKLGDQVNTINGTNTSIIQRNRQTVDYTCVLTDAGKFIYLGSGSHTFTIPANTSVAYDIGTPITFVNLVGGGTLTIACGDTMVLMNGAVSPTTGTRTLANYGIATALKVDTTLWAITGSGLT